MLSSPFTFYRGAAAVMAADLAKTPNSDIVVQACGDAHTSNFGGFAAPDRKLIFGPNDFDETLPGPWELYDPADTRDEADCVGDLLEAYVASLDEDRRYLFETYRFVDMARKVVGVGSVGTRAWVLLYVGRRGKDPLILQMKEAVASVLEPYLGASEFESDGERVVRGQRMDQAVTDVFLGWQRSQGLDGKEHDFYVRQLWDWKASIDLSAMNYAGLHAYTRACGWSLARAHARSSDRLAFSAYLGAGRKFDEAIARFSAAYAVQNELDHRRLADAIAAGEVPAETGV